MKRMLVIDDDRDYAGTVARRCRGMGFESAFAATALEAVGMLTAAEFHVIILDVDMPTDGYSVSEFVRSSAQYQKTPIIFLTGRQDHETVCRCVAMGGHYMFKSLDVWPRLQRMLNELIEDTATSPQ